MYRMVYLERLVGHQVYHGVILTTSFHIYCTCCLSSSLHKVYFHSYNCLDNFLRKRSYSRIIIRTSVSDTSLPLRKIQHFPQRLSHWK